MQFVIALGILVLIISVGMLVFWFLEHYWSPQRKPWCVLFYLNGQIPNGVGTPMSQTGTPSDSALLDAKLTQVVQHIRALPCSTAALIGANPGWDDVYVAYRAIWNDRFKSPEARVVRPETSAPYDDYFDNEYDIDLRGDLNRDIRAFFSWVYDNCPADRYAVFFWGHSLGPGGLFYQSEPPLVVRPIYVIFVAAVRRLIGKNRWSGVIGLEGLRVALHAVVEKRIRDSKSRFRVEPGDGGEASTASSSAPPPAPPPPGPPPLPPPPSVRPVPKVEIVLFQDCWMSGLETLFQLQDDARYIIASQSLVPVGYADDGSGNPGAVWPYKALIDCLLQNPQFAPAMMTVLEQFFNQAGPPATVGGPPTFPNRYPAKKVLFSLLDSHAMAGEVSWKLKGKLLALVNALNPLGVNVRYQLIDQAERTAGRLYEPKPLTSALEVGDQALIDVLAFLAYLKTPSLWPVTRPVVETDAIRNAADALDQELRGFRVTTFQSPARNQGEPMYEGITALYRTKNVAIGIDEFVQRTVRLDYEYLRFALDTDANPPAGPGTSATSWTEYAYEQYP
jgi:hypothetical protein